MYINELGWFFLNDYLQHSTASYPVGVCGGLRLIEECVHVR